MSKAKTTKKKKAVNIPEHIYGNHVLFTWKQAPMPIVINVKNSGSEELPAIIFCANDARASDNFGNDKNITVASGVPNVSYRFIIEDSKVNPLQCCRIMFICDNEDFFDNKLEYFTNTRAGTRTMTPFMIPAYPWGYQSTLRDMECSITLNGKSGIKMLVPPLTTVTMYLYPHPSTEKDTVNAYPLNLPLLKPTKKQIADHQAKVKEYEKAMPKILAQQAKKEKSLVDEKCCICDCKLTYREANIEFSPYALGHTCKKHHQYAFYLQPEVTKKKLGLIKKYPDKMTKCAMCNAKLSKKEQDKIGEFDHFIACEKHRDAIAVSIPSEQFQRAWFIYKETAKKPTKQDFIEWCNSEEGIQARKDIREKLKTSKSQRKLTQK